MPINDTSFVNSILRREYPDIDDTQLILLSDTWDTVIDRVILKMLEICDPVMTEIHINLKEEMALEMSYIINFISNKVVTKRLAGRHPNTLKVDDEKITCFDENGVDVINNTAISIAKNIWLKKYNERWKPKTLKALEKESLPTKNTIIQNPPEVDKNHFIPKFFIKKYWSTDHKINICKILNGEVKTDRKSYGKWGHQLNLYSNGLEYYLGLIEGDAERPLAMMINMEPLNRPQKDALIGFIVILYLRNPYFIEGFQKNMVPFVTKFAGADKAKCPEYMTLMYESIYKNNELYEKFARPFYDNAWVIITSEHSEFILPDTGSVFIPYNDEQYVIAPITPCICLMILPFKNMEDRGIPYRIESSPCLKDNLLSVLISKTEKQFLSGESLILPPHNMKNIQVELINEIYTAIGNKYKIEPNQSK